MEIKAHYNGEVFVPDEPVNLEKGERVVVSRKKAKTPRPHVTAADLLRNGFVGAWKHRTDITDSVEFARKLREKSNTPRYRW